MIHLELFLAVKVCTEDNEREREFKLDNLKKPEDRKTLKCSK